MPEKETAKTLTDKVETLSALIIERMDRGEKGLETLRGEVGGVRVELKKQEDWISEIEKRYEKARFSAGGFDTQKLAIPERYRKSIDVAARAGYKDPARIAACAAWLKHVTRVCVPARFGIRSIAPYLEELDKLEESFGMEPRAKAALQEGTGSEGGFTVPTPLEADVLRVIEDNAIVRALARKISMVAFQHNIPDLATGVVVDIIDEEATITETEMTFGQKAILAKKFAARGILSLELQQDAAIGIVDFWLTLAEEKLGQKEDSQSLEGDGVGASFTGLVAASGVNQVQALTGGVATNGGIVKYDELVEAKWKAKKRSTRRGAAWCMPPELARNAEALVDTNGRPLWSNPTAGNLTLLGAPSNGGPDGVLLGFPVWTSDEIRVDRTVGTLTTAGNVYFGPFGHGMIFGDLSGILFGVSEHVLWNTAQLVARLIKRTAILVGVPADFTKYTGVDAS